MASRTGLGRCCFGQRMELDTKEYLRGTAVCGIDCRRDGDEPGAGNSSETEGK